MQGFEICPRCSAHFEGRRALVFGGVATSHGFTLPAASSKVRCPRCGHVFSGRNIRYFGFLSAGMLTLLGLLAIFLFLLGVFLSSL